jgi:hypothetical protein
VLTYMVTHVVQSNSLTLFLNNDDDDDNNIYFPVNVVQSQVTTTCDIIRCTQEQHNCLEHFVKYIVRNLVQGC